MAPFLKRLTEASAILVAISGAYATPLHTKIETIKRLLGRDNFEWTAFGDSYASGVGSGEYTPNSYRFQINGDARLPIGGHQFHNAVCSGSSTADVEKYQFFDENTSGKPNWQYGDRPRFGDPSIATINVGGNDIDFPGIIFNCILELRMPYDLADKIDTTIKKIVERGRKGAIGNNFKLYVTGFPQFFDTTTTDCDKVTFARTANPKDDGLEHTRMTQAQRKEFNDMSVQLNKAIEDAVSRNKDQGAKWIPIDGEMNGHRFCEHGVQEPKQDNPNLWLWHYPYNEPSDGTIDGPLQRSFDKISAGVNIQDTYQTYASFENAQLENLDVNSSSAFLDTLWKGLGNRVKVFHPQDSLHEKIRDLILDTYIGDLGGSGTTPPPSTSPSPSSSPSPAPIPEKNACHGVGGDFWVMSRDQAVTNAQDFCKQNNREVTYNQGSVNELKMSIRKLQDDKKGPTDAPECVGRFTNIVIDGCDGNDPLNNPHNYKFGSTYTSSDGWEYTMQPLSKQVNEVSCDVSYKFALDYFEIRGKNLPDAKFGANGDGLKTQLSGCGAITKWNFERTPNDVKFQWYATGQLPIGTKACVGRALESAGGSGNGNCHGSGKRSVSKRRAIGIEDWPGYGDDSKHIFASSPVEKRDSIDDWPGYGDDDKHVFRHPATD